MIIFEINEEVIERMQRKSEQQTQEIDKMKEKCEQVENKQVKFNLLLIFIYY